MSLIVGRSKPPTKKGGRSKPPTKKGGTGRGCRKALSDITNMPSLHHEASSRKTNLSDEEFNIEEEMFLHDHSKCIEAQIKSIGPCLLAAVLPGHDSVFHFEDPVSKQTEFGLDSPRWYPELDESSMSEFSDWLAVSTQSESSPSSPLRWDSPPSSPFAWKSLLDPVNFVLEEDSVSHSEDPVSEQTESGLDFPRCYPELVELLKSKFFDSLAVSTQSC
ncbi:hypothetical protein U1Q18_017702 [Sarracenia purpurea var. burkii]